MKKKLFRIRNLSFSCRNKKKFLTDTLFFSMCEKTYVGNEYQKNGAFDG